VNIHIGNIRSSIGDLQQELKGIKNQFETKTNDLSSKLDQQTEHLRTCIQLLSNKTDRRSNRMDAKMDTVIYSFLACLFLTGVLFNTDMSHDGAGQNRGPQKETVSKMVALTKQQSAYPFCE